MQQRQQTKPRPFGHYFILEKIAQGGMAEIFKGLTYDFTGLKKFIVIKRILPHIAVNQEFINMLIDEAKIAVHLNHGNIAQTYDLGKVAEDYFIVMEYVEGKTLSQIFKKLTTLRQPIPLPIAAYLTAEVCHGLEYIHRRTDDHGHPLGIVHCDISPQNIIVSELGNLKIVDFGVAKAAFNLSERERGVLKGKFAYMSPEQAEGLQVTPASDIFSTGILLWEILTGRRLFKKKSNSETIEAVQTAVIYPPSAYRNDIPSDMDAIVMNALNRDPRLRYSSAADMALALTKFNLKYFPDFKAAQIGAFLSELFVDEDATRDIFHEKTYYEEATVHQIASPTQEAAEESPLPADETMVLNPQELDFVSLFDEIDLDEVSEVTRAISLNGAQVGSDNSDFGEDEPTGDLPDLKEQELLLNSLTLRRVKPPQVAQISQSAPKSPMLPVSSPRKRALQILGGLFVLGGFVFGAELFFSNAPSQLRIEYVPKDAKVLLNGVIQSGTSPLEISSLKPRTPYELTVTRLGYEPQTRIFRLWPRGEKELNVELKKLSGGSLEITSLPLGASVYWNGKRLPQKTPTVLETEEFSFPATVGLALKDEILWTQQISALPDKDIHWDVDLTVPYAWLDVRSLPAGAEVFFDGKKIGKTPLYALSVQAEKKISLRLKLKGYQEQEQELTCGEGGKEQIYFVLQKAPPR